MIQIYQRGNADYSKNGDAVLFPTECSIRAKLNAVWELELTHPIDGDGRWKHIEEEAVISAPTFQGKKQLFRIDKVDKDDDEVTAVAYPVFFDSSDDCFLMDVRPTVKKGQEALDIMTAGSKYSGQSDITAVSTAYFVRRNLMSAINGEEDPSFISRWGGEILYDNYKIIINERVGGDYGVEVRYGKNMSGINYQVDMADVVTRIVPVAYNGYTLDGTSPWVDSPNISKYAKMYTKEVKFDDVKLAEDASEDEESYETISQLRAELRRRCNELYSNGIDLPKVTINIDMVDLSGSDEYDEYKDIEKIGLGDTVKCYNSRLDITTEARAIEIEWDCIRDVVREVVLGDFEYNYFSEVSSALDSLTGRVNNAVRGDGSIVASAVKGFLDATKTQLWYQKNVAKRQDVRAILFEDLDQSSLLYGAMALGTQGLQISKKRTADGRDWDWSTALTANGLIANIIVAGILSDKKGLNYWDLDTGEFSLSATGFKIDGKEPDVYFIDSMSQTDVLNKLTNNGQDKGIYLLDGKLYISFSAARGGNLTLGGANNVNGTLVILDRLGKQIGKWDKDGIDAANGSFSGTITSSDGKVGGFTIGAHGLRLGDLVQNTDVDKEGNESVYLGEKGIKIRNGETKNIISFQDGMVYLYDTAPMLQGGIGCGGGAYGDSGFGIYQPVGGSAPDHWKRVLGTSVSTDRKLNVYANFTVSSSYTKSKEANTDNYGHRLLYCYEMPSPMFGDIGEGETDEYGECYVDIGDIFSETIADNIEYHVFLQKEGPGDIWVDSKHPSFFVVKGTMNTRFAWEVKAKQKGFEFERLEIFDDEPQDPGADYETEYMCEIDQLQDSGIDYKSEYMYEVKQLLEEKEEILYETA